MQPERICVSPGPCSPAEAGISIELIQHFAGKLPILGVCLGHQAIGAAFGADIVRAQQIIPGKVSNITHTATHVLTGLPTPFPVPNPEKLRAGKTAAHSCAPPMSPYHKKKK